MKILLLENVKRDNVKFDGKLEAGIYNIAYDGVMSFMPFYRGYNGNEWDNSLEFGSMDMTVFVRVADYTDKEKWSF